MYLIKLKSILDKNNLQSLTYNAGMEIIKFFDTYINSINGLRTILKTSKRIIPNEVDRLYIFTVVVLFIWERS